MGKGNGGASSSRWSFLIPVLLLLREDLVSGLSGAMEFDLPLTDALDLKELVLPIS